MKTNYDDQPEWIQSSKITLNYLISILGEDIWDERRKKVVAYFKSLNEFQFQHKEKALPHKAAHPIALYDDWMGWYMYLVECLADRPTCDEPLQSARIYPFFSALGRNLELLKSMEGIADRINEVLNSNKNQPDSTLFELLIALCYARNGWTVSFLKESPPDKTPDLFVTRGSESFYVECKRFAKTTGYQENERQSWLKHWSLLNKVLAENGVPVFIDVEFNCEVTNVEQAELVIACAELMQNLHQETISIEKQDFRISATMINMAAVESHFEEYSVRYSSPQLIELLAGEYVPLGNYTHSVRPTGISEIGPDDGLHSCNVFLEGIAEAYIAKWDCTAPESIAAKAKDVTKMLSKASSQLPDTAPSCIHLGYETLSGTAVEFERHAKITETMMNFDYGKKDVVATFCHALQPIAKVDEFECAETTAYYGAAALSILEDFLLLDDPTVVSEPSTHWLQDSKTPL